MSPKNVPVDSVKLTLVKYVSCDSNTPFELQK